MESMVALAIEQGSTRDFPAISLDADGSSTHGVILDHFRIVAHAARAASSSGHPLDAKQPNRDLAHVQTLFIAFPRRCGDRAVSAASVDLVPAQGGVRREGDLLNGEGLARVLPGATLPSGAVGAAYALERPRPGDSVKVVYPEGACDGSNEVLLPLTFTAARPLQTPAPVLPEGHPATERPVRLQALLDFDGRPQQVVYFGGPSTLTQAATDAVRAWTTEPARINGAPVISPVTFQVKFQPK
jgi:hypothetical protein